MRLGAMTKCCTCYSASKLLRLDVGLQWVDTWLSFRFGLWSRVEVGRLISFAIP